MAGSARRAEARLVAERLLDHDAALDARHPQSWSLSTTSAKRSGGTAM